MSVSRRDFQGFRVDVREPGWFGAAFERIIRPDPTPATDLTPESLSKLCLEFDSVKLDPDTNDDIWWHSPESLAHHHNKSCRDFTWQKIEMVNRAAAAHGSGVAVSLDGDRWMYFSYSWAPSE